MKSSESSKEADDEGGEDIEPFKQGDGAVDDDGEPLISDVLDDEDGDPLQESDGLLMVTWSHQRKSTVQMMAVRL